MHVSIFSPAQNRRKCPPHQKRELIRVHVPRVDWLEQLLPSLWVENRLKNLRGSVDLCRKCRQISKAVEGWWMRDPGWRKKKRQVEMRLRTR